VKWPWGKRRPPPTIPPYRVPVQEQKPKDHPGIIVEEVDTSAMTQTGIHKAWDKLAGK
jgi:hypothetical protein